MEGRRDPRKHARHFARRAFLLLVFPVTQIVTVGFSSDALPSAPLTFRFQRNSFTLSRKGPTLKYSGLHIPIFDRLWRTLRRARFRHVNVRFLLLQVRQDSRHRPHPLVRRRRQARFLPGRYVPPHFETGGSRNAFRPVSGGGGVREGPLPATRRLDDTPFPGAVPFEDCPDRKGDCG